VGLGKTIQTISVRTPKKTQADFILALFFA
jgi:hypothetical protein